MNLLFQDLSHMLPFYEDKNVQQTFWDVVLNRPFSIDGTPQHQQGMEYGTEMWIVT